MQYLWICSFQPFANFPSAGRKYAFLTRPPLRKKSPAIPDLRKKSPAIPDLRKSGIAGLFFRKSGIAGLFFRNGGRVKNAYFRPADGKFANG